MHNVLEVASVASLVALVLGSGVWVSCSRNYVIIVPPPASQGAKTLHTSFSKLPIHTTLISKDDSHLEYFLLGSTPKIVALTVSVTLVLAGVGTAVALSTVLVDRQSQDYLDSFAAVKGRVVESVESQPVPSAIGGGDEGLAPGAIAGITIGSIVGLIVLAVVVVLSILCGCYCFITCCNDP
jgi:hypothetical protein